MIRIPDHQLDSAFLLEILSTLFDRNGPYSTLLQAAIDTSKTWMQDAETLCNSLLSASSSLYNAFDNHAYYILIPLAYISQVLGPETTLSYLNSLSFFGLIYLSYLSLRKENVTLLVAILFSFIIIFHPAWQYSISGNFYLDRFYMPIALLYLLALESIIKNEPKAHITLGVILLGLAGSIISERSAIMILFSTLALLVIYKNNRHANKSYKAFGIFSIFLILYIAWYIKFRFVGVDTGGTLTDTSSKLFSSFYRLQNEAVLDRLITFMSVNTFSLILLSIPAGVGITALALGSVIPNIVVTVGGAELTGWSTHYHSTYFPILIFCTIKGIVALSEKSHKYITGLLSLLLLSFNFFLLSFNPFNGEFRNNISFQLSIPTIANAFKFYHDPQNSSDKNLLENRRRLQHVFDGPKYITAIEAAMPSLYNGHRLSLFPTGIDQADYAVLRLVQDVSLGEVYKGVVSYRDSNSRLILDRCFDSRLKKNFDTEHPVIVNNIAILRRADKNPSDSLEKAIGSPDSLWYTKEGVAVTKHSTSSLQENDFLFTSIKTNSHVIHRYSVLAYCPEQSIIRMQVNWMNQTGALDNLDIIPRACHQHETLSIDVIAPQNAILATPYLTNLSPHSIQIKDIRFIEIE